MRTIRISYIRIHTNVENTVSYYSVDGYSVAQDNMCGCFKLTCDLSMFSKEEMLKVVMNHLAYFKADVSDIEVQYYEYR